MSAPIRVAIADDARFVRDALARLLEGDRRVAVVGVASSGEELLANLDAWRPDAVTLDLQMPGQGGLATLDKLMARRRLPVIILSTRSGEGAPVTLEALSRGAADFIDKEAYSLVDFAALREVLVGKLLTVTGCEAGPAVAAAEVRLEAAPKAVAPLVPARRLLHAARLAIIGASTGGPRAVETVLRSLGGESPVPVLVVQHMPVGFTRAFAERLDRVVGLPVAEAADGETLKPGTVRVAPAGRQLTLICEGASFRVALGDLPSGSLHKPSVDVTMLSAARVAGAAVAAVLLTGMGSDGADGMTALALAGSPTIAQDEESCIVFGMPRAAILRGGAREVLPLSHIGPRLRRLCMNPAAASAAVTRAHA